MRVTIIALAAVLAASPLAAQEQPKLPSSVTFTILQWESMDRDLHKVSMPEEAHQAVHSIMNQYVQELMRQAAQAKSPPAPTSP